MRDDGLLAVGARAAESGAGAGGVAVGAPLLAGVALIAVGACVDGCLEPPPGKRDRDHRPGLAVGAGQAVLRQASVQNRCRPIGRHAAQQTGQSGGAAGRVVVGCRNVKNWKDETMALRWCAAGMVAAGKQFRRVNGHLHLPRLRAALDAHVTASVRPTVQDEEVSSLTITGPPPKLHGARDNLHSFP